MFKRATFDTYQVFDRHAHVGVEHFAEVPVGGHVGDRPHFNSGGVHRHDYFADAGVRWAFFARATDEVAKIGKFAETGPDFLSVDDPLVAVTHCRGGQRCQVAASVGFAHADAPGGVAAQHVGQKLFTLVSAAIANERRAHLAIGKPHASNWGAGGNHFFTHD